MRPSRDLVGAVSAKAGSDLILLPNDTYTISHLDRRPIRYRAGGLPPRNWTTPTDTLIVGGRDRPSPTRFVTAHFLDRTVKF